MNSSGAVLETIYFGNKISQGGAVIHSGDNQTGDGKGDDETILIDFSKMHPNVDSIWPVITIYTAGDEFDDVRGAYSRIFDGITGAEFIRFNLSANRDNISNGNILANFKRNGNGWTFKARGYYTRNTR
jgi:tellurium resistance protein TerZ